MSYDNEDITVLVNVAGKIERVTLTDNQVSDLLENNLALRRENELLKGWISRLKAQIEKVGAK